MSDILSIGDTMKKIFSIAILCLVVVLFLTSCDSKVEDKKSSNDDIDIEEKENNTEEKEVYKDDNPIKLRLYMIDDYNNYIPVIEHTNVWRMSTDIGVFSVIPTEEEIVNDNYYQTIFFRHWNSYKNAEDYKIGYNIKFTLKDNTVFDKNILEPPYDSVFWPYLFVYVYDDVNIPPGTWHSHLTPEQVKTNTKFTSIKLTGNYNTSSDIISPIELTVFTYKNDNDFDKETGKYRGSSFYKIVIYEKK